MQKLAIGIDIGGTNVTFGIVKPDGEVLYKESSPFKEYQTPELLVNYLSTRIKNKHKSDYSDFEIQGIGIGAPNGNYHSGTIEFAPNLLWKGIIPLAKMFEQKTGFKSLLTNDANAAAVGEMVYGNAKGFNDFMMITLGTGVGSGFVSNGQLILGHDGLAGELGHTIFDPNGRACNCGRKGCLETYASANGIVRTAREFLEKSNEQSVLRNYHLQEITSKHIYEAAKLSDKIALEIFEYTGYVLGFTLANAAAITSPKAIFLFGGLANAGDFIFTPTKNHMENNLLHIYKNKIELLPSALPENDAAILGAAALVWEN